MFKFFRKIFLILIIGVLIFGWVKFKNFDIKNVFQEQDFSFKVVSDFLLKNVFNSSTQTEVDSYKLESLKNGDNDAEKNTEKEFGGTEDAIITLINKERFDAGLNTLKKNEKLMKSALAKADDMKKDRYFEHVSTRKIQPWFFVEENNYRYEKFGENIALDYLSANSVHKAFMDSVGHRANMLDEDFKDVGVAIFPVETEEGVKYIVVEHFGRQLKKINVEKREKYSDKSKKFCGLQKDKKEELKKMIDNQEKVIEEFQNEVNRKAVEEENRRLEIMKGIKGRINEYLDDCKTLKKKYKK